MASVVRRRRKNGKVSWYARYRDGRGKDVWEKCASAKDARARAAEVETLLARTGGAWSPPVKVTVAEYAERWLVERGPALRERTLHGYRRSFDREILPELRTDPARGAQPRAHQGVRVETGQQGRGGEHDPQRARADARDALHGGRGRTRARERRAAAAPRRAARPRRSRPRRGSRSRRCFACAGDGARGPIELAAASGLRRGEVFALRWRDVDFERRLIHVRGSNHNGVITAPKTAAGERLVPMFGSLRGLLLELKAASPFKAPDDFVFPAATGEARNPAGWMRWEFYPALEALEGAAVPVPRPAALRRLAADRAGREHPPDLADRRPRRPEHHPQGLLAPARGRARRGGRPLRPARQPHRCGTPIAVKARRPPQQGPAAADSRSPRRRTFRGLPRPSVDRLDLGRPPGPARCCRFTGEAPEGLCPRLFGLTPRRSPPVAGRQYNAYAHARKEVRVRQVVWPSWRTLSTTLDRARLPPGYMIPPVRLREYPVCASVQMMCEILLIGTGADARWRRRPLRHGETAAARR